ncbi:MAG: tRNA lysidine(34) synthetase TilS [Spirochaetes bacterium GWF1_51_8]|nr:MAG: tRNA lysidine(34) synthetase TilS [Spirochaetes bacterium GWF1_51_8]
MTPCDELRRIFLETSRKYSLIDAGDKVLIALSGGADSVCLAHLLTGLKDELGIELCAAHIHHGIRGSEAGRDLEFSRGLAGRLGMEFRERHVDVPGYAGERGMSLEHAARELRYAALKEAAVELGANKTATAHHLDDLAETMLFRLFKGTGPSGIPAIRLKMGGVIRPLLFISRRDIMEYISAHGLEYVEDSTNRDTGMPRNYIRANVIPVIETGFPDFREHLRDYYLLARGDEEYFRRVMKGLRKYVTRREGRVCIDKAIFADTKRIPAVRRFIRETVAREMDSGFRANLSFMENLIKFCDKSDGTREIFRSKKFRVFSSYSEFVLEKMDKNCQNTPIHAKLLDGFSAGIGNRTFRFGSGDFSRDDTTACVFDPSGITEIVIRGWKEGDRIAISGGGTKKLQDLFTDIKVPRWLRAGAAVFTDGGGRVIGVYIPGRGFRISSDFYVHDGIPGMSIRVI